VKKVFSKSSQNFELGGASTFLENSQTLNTFLRAKDATQKIKKVKKQQMLINI
jgi:hypothetical protein